MIGFANNAQPRRCSFVDSVTRPVVLVVTAVLMLAFLAPHHCSEAAAAPVVDKTELPLGEVVDRFVWLSSQTCLLITGRGSLYRSRDGGGTWISQDSALLAAVNASTSTAAHGSVQVTSVHPSADPTKAMIIGKKDEQAVLWLYRSGIDSERQPQDSLKVNYTAVSLTQSLFDASMHATEPGWALALRWSSDCPLGSNCNQELMLTQDLGLTWQQVATKVRQYSWADIKTSTRSKQQIWLVWEDEQEDVDYATTQSRWVPGQELSIGHTDDFGQRFTVWKRAAPRFTYTAPFIFVSVLEPQRYDRMGLYVMNVAADGRDSRLVPASFPLDRDLQTWFQGTREIMHLGAEAGAYVGLSDEGYTYLNVYRSDEAGLSYTLSLGHVHHLQHGSAQFLQVKGLPGIHIANTLENWDSSVVTEAPLLKTTITSNNGGLWQSLAAPKGVDCVGECRLHLHVGSHQERIGSCSSTSDAVGLIVCTGNVGQYLSPLADDVETFLSLDGGLSWKMISERSTLHAFANNGSIIVLAENHRLTSEISYSLDGGMDWLRFSFTNQPLQVASLRAIPFYQATAFETAQPAGARFLLHGILSSRSIVFTIDFTSDTFSSSCADSDYELWQWTASGNSGLVIDADAQQSLCLMGNHSQYLRLRPGTACWSTRIHNINASSTAIVPCNCTEMDWECDRDFRRAPPTKEHDLGVCVLNGKPPADPPADCVKGQTYIRSRGYRKIPGNLCSGGVDHSGETKQCPDKHSGAIGSQGSRTLLVLIVLACTITALVIVVAVAVRSSWVRKQLKFIPWENCYMPSSSSSSTSGRRRRAHQHDEEEDENSEPLMHDAEGLIH